MRSPSLVTPSAFLDAAVRKRIDIFIALAGRAVFDASGVPDKPGIAAKVFGAIPNMNVRMISQGASEINISFVIEEDDVPEAIECLHKAFFADPDPEIFGEVLSK